MKQTVMTVNQAIKKLSRTTKQAIKNETYDQAINSIQGLKILTNLNEKYEKDIILQQEQTPSYELEYAFCEVFKKANKPVTFVELKNQMSFEPSSVDKVRYNGKGAPRWVVRTNALLRSYQERKWAKFNSDQKWSLTRKGKQELKKDGYF